MFHGEKSLSHAEETQNVIPEASCISMEDVFVV